ncbi:hypothetical protein H4S14_003477 [Agrobacterium vitis]|nr:hypothetical protein [Agrobacterium vitis]MBE1439712.1 hypothetical protein [Agrobacterium vitis]
MTVSNGSVKASGLAFVWEKWNPVFLSDRRVPWLDAVSTNVGVFDDKT